MLIEAFFQKRRQDTGVQSALREQKPSLGWLLVLVASAILLPMLPTGCSKKGQEGEKKTVQKSEDDFLDPDPKPDERKYLLAAKPFFVAVANRKLSRRLCPTLQIRHRADVPRAIQAF
jgi:hypothetical protein